MKNHLILLNELNQPIFEGTLKNPTKEIAKKAGVPLKKLLEEFTVFFDGREVKEFGEEFSVCVMKKKNKKVVSKNREVQKVLSSGIFDEDFRLEEEEKVFGSLDEARVFQSEQWASNFDEHLEDALKAVFN